MCVCVWREERGRGTWGGGGGRIECGNGDGRGGGGGRKPYTLNPHLDYYIYDHSALVMKIFVAESVVTKYHAMTLTCHVMNQSYM